MGKIENIALFDMDGTLCDYEKALLEGLEKIRSPDERSINCIDFRDCPTYLQNRIDLISSSEEWWENLPRFKLGWDVFNIANGLGYKVNILTQGVRRNPKAWSGKKKWIDNNLGADLNVNIVRDKGLVYGKVLVDDFPGYIERWLEWRPRGVVIMPAAKHNIDYKHPQVTRYDGSNLDEVRAVMERARLRE